MKNELNFNSDRKARKVPRKKDTESPEFYTEYDSVYTDKDFIEQFTKDYSSKTYSTDNEWN